MACRWTKAELAKMDYITFIIEVLQERREKVVRYSDLGVKLERAIVLMQRLRGVSTSCHNSVVSLVSAFHRCD